MSIESNNNIAKSFAKCSITELKKVRQLLTKHSATLEVLAANSKEIIEMTDENVELVMLLARWARHLYEACMGCATLLGYSKFIRADIRIVLLLRICQAFNNPNEQEELAAQSVFMVATMFRDNVDTDVINQFEQFE